MAEYLLNKPAEWRKTFPDELYKEWFRLKGWDHLDPKTQRPAYLGHITNDLVYDRILPAEVNDELRDRCGDTNCKLHTFLSEEKGRKKLEEHLIKLKTLAQVSSSWDGYIETVDLVAPRVGCMT
ncbi:MAG: P63C domain-containing protein [Halothece sp.]